MKPDNRDGKLKLTEWADEVLEALDGMQENFEENQLAYLTLTSKTETQIRDAVAYQLHQMFGESYLVAREFSLDGHRFDLAVLSRDDTTDQIEFLLEAKMHYTADFVKGIPAPLAKEVEIDISKIAGKKGLFLHLLTTPMRPIPQDLAVVLKYGYLVNKGLASSESAEILRNQGVANLLRHMKETYPEYRIEPVTFSAGEAFGIAVEYDALLAIPEV
jgi:hypothetical protein